MDVGAQGYGSVGYGMTPMTFTLRTRIDVARIGYGQQPYGWGGYGGAVIPESAASSGNVSHRLRWIRRGRR